MLSQTFVCGNDVETKEQTADRIVERFSDSETSSRDHVEGDHQSFPLGNGMFNWRKFRMNFS
jgi:hypothetical protein